MIGEGKAIFIGALIIVAAAFATLALLMRYAPALGLLDHPDARKRHGRVVPLVGGLSAMVGLLTGALWFDGLNPVDRFLLASATVVVVVGAFDDRRSLGVRTRLLVQSTMILAMMAVTGTYVHQLGMLFGHQVQLGWFGVPFTLVAMIGLLNAFNLIDGIDGLASVLALVAIGGILLASTPVWGHGTRMLLVILALAMLPQLAGNLGMFGRRGKCFLGSAGSTLLGYLIGWALIRLSQTPGSSLSPVGTLWCVAIPVLDTLAVMYRRMRANQSPFKPGRKHLHYLLMDFGFGARATLLVITVAALAVWCFGALVRALHLGAGSNLIAFCVMLVAYVYATRKLDAKLAARVGSPGFVSAPAHDTSPLPPVPDRADAGLVRTSIAQANDRRET